MNSSGHIVFHGSLRPAKRNAIRLRDVNPSQRIEVYAGPSRSRTAWRGRIAEEGNDT